MVGILTGLERVWGDGGVDPGSMSWAGEGGGMVVEATNDDLPTGLARFYERSLEGVAKRMGELPGRDTEEIAQTW